MDHIFKFQKQYHMHSIKSTDCHVALKFKCNTSTFTMVFQSPKQSKKLFSILNQKKIDNLSPLLDICTTVLPQRTIVGSKITKKVKNVGLYTQSGISALYQASRSNCQSSQSNYQTSSHQTRRGRPHKTNIKSIPELKRHDKKFYDDLVRPGPKHDPVQIPDGYGVSGKKQLLRPRNTSRPGKEPPANPFKNIIGSFCASNLPLLSVINEFLGMHADQSSNCDGIEIDFIDCIKCGLSYRVKVTCKSCGLTGDRQPIYNTINKTGPRQFGPKRSQLNVGLGIGIQHTPIGPTKMIQALSHATLAAPCLSQCQRTASYVCDKTMEVAEMDRNEKQELVKLVMKERGASPLIPLSNDTQYNGKTGRSRHTPGSAGNSAQCITMENATKSHYVLDRQLANRICTARTNSKNKFAQRKVHCMSKSGRHGNLKCTRTQRQGDIIDEGLLAEKSAKVLAAKGIVGSVLCSDSDADIIAGFRKHMPHIVWNKDLVHNTKAQITAAEKAPFSRGIFDSLHTGHQRRKAKQAFANDIGVRCGIIHKIIHEKANGDLNKMQKLAVSTIDPLITCYSGNHKECRYRAIVRYSCTGTGRSGKTWFNKSGYLKAQNITHLSLTVSDKSTLKRLLQIKLGPETIEQTFRRYTTQPNECINNSFRSYLSRHRGFNRNGPGRIDSCILVWNNGLQKSNEMLSKSVGVHDPLGSPSTKAIQDSENRLNYTRAYQRRPSVKLRLQKQRSKLKMDHFDCAKKRHNELAYAKNQLEQEVLMHDPSKLSSKSMTKYKKRVKRLNETWKKAKNADNARLLRNRKARAERLRRAKMSDCIHCKRKIEQAKLSFNCAGCNRKQHAHCGQLVPNGRISSHVNYTTLTWYCDDCKHGMPLDMNSCIFCTLQVEFTDKGLSCDNCDKWQHIECQNIMSKAKYKHAIDTGKMPQWICYCCKK